MASVGYGAYNFGVAAYGTPQYQVASATIAQTSDFDAVAGFNISCVCNISADFWIYFIGFTG
jgi:hypothetical protein